MSNHNLILPSIIVPFSAYLREFGTQHHGPEGKCLSKKTIVVTKANQFEHSKMCIDHITGCKLKSKLESNVSSNILRIPSDNIHRSHNNENTTAHSQTKLTNKCYKGPGNINEQRKFKRRCLGIHTFPIIFDR